MFRSEIALPANLLHRDGVAKYFGILFPLDSANEFFSRLFNGIQWHNDEAVIFGKRIVTKRKVAWYADQPYAYTYSNTTKHALLWNEDLLAIKATVESKLGTSFNSCLLNLYHDGNEGMAWHSDAEKDLERNGQIASLSFGAERKFSFKHKRTNETQSLILEHGSLLLMAGETQTNWLHRLPPAKKVHEPRINLTFRNIVSNAGLKLSGEA